MRDWNRGAAVSDLETTRALGQVTAALSHLETSVRDLSTKIEGVAADGREDRRELQEKLDGLQTDTRNRLHELRNDLLGTVITLGRDVTALETGLENHVQNNREQFARLEDAVEASTHDRGKLWRAVAGMGSAGGLGALLARLVGENLDK